LFSYYFKIKTAVFTTCTNCHLPGKREFSHGGKELPHSQANEWEFKTPDHVYHIYAWFC